jgi:valyl-tRNA synthetase
MGVIGPRFKKQARTFMEVVRSLPMEQLVQPPETLSLDGDEVPVPENSFTPLFSYIVEGKKVDLIRIGGMFVTIPQPS